MTPTEPTAPLTEGQQRALAIVARLLTGRETVAEVARALGTSGQTVRDVWQGRTHQRLWGDPLPWAPVCPGVKRPSPEGRSLAPDERFWRRVQRGTPDECWPWDKPGTGRYGTFRAEGRRHQAHRYAYAATRGPIPEGLHVLHRCDTPPCCNPAHLWLGTHADNMRDKTRKGRGNYGGKHANRLTEEQVRGALERLRRGETAASISRDLGVGPDHVRKIARGISWAWIQGASDPPPRPHARSAPRHGTATGTAKLDEAQVRQIAERLRAGERQHNLAEEFRVSPSTISNIRTGRRWQRLLEDNNRDHSDDCGGPVVKSRVERSETAG